jgi:hypothetical protein
MTPEQNARLEELENKSRLAAQRLQRVALILGQAAWRRALGARPSEDEASQIAAYNQTLKRIEEITDQQEKLLREAGILPGA